MENYTEKFICSLAQRDEELKKIGGLFKWWWGIDWEAPTYVLGTENWRNCIEAIIAKIYLVMQYWKEREHKQWHSLNMSVNVITYCMSTF